MTDANGAAAPPASTEKLWRSVNSTNSDLLVFMFPSQNIPKLLLLLLLMKTRQIRFKNDPKLTLLWISRLWMGRLLAGVGLEERIRALPEGLETPVRAGIRSTSASTIGLATLLGTREC